MAKDMMQFLLESLDPLLQTMNELSLCTFSDMMVVDDNYRWNNEIQGCSHAVLKRVSRSDRIPMLPVRDGRIGGQMLLTPSKSLPVEPIPSGQIAMEAGDDSASADAIKFTSSVQVELEAPTGMETAGSTMENGRRSPNGAKGDSSHQIIEEYIPGGHTPPLANGGKGDISQQIIEEYIPGGHTPPLASPSIPASLNVETDGVTVELNDDDLGNDSWSNHGIESMSNCPGVEVSSLNPLEEQGAETVQPCMENGDCEPHETLSCNDCGRNPILGLLFRSCNILGYNLCVQCFQATGAKRGEYIMIDPFYFEDRTALMRTMQTISPEDDSDSDSSKTGQKSSKKQSHEAELATLLSPEDFEAKLGVLALDDSCENQKSQAELFGRDNLSPSEDLSALEEWDEMTEDLQDFGYSAG